MNKVKVTLKRSLIGHKKLFREIIKLLGLRKINSSAIHKVNPSIIGMIRKVEHLLLIEELK